MKQFKSQTTSIIKKFKKNLLNLDNRITTISRLIIIGLLFISSPIFAVEKYKYTVAQDGSGDFTSIQSAIDASKCFPDEPVTITVKKGIYHEKVCVPSMNTHLSLIGESPENTIITFNDFFNKINRGRNSTFYTYTLLVEANDFVLENITVENSAGAVGQAVALHVEGDRSIFRNCRILGNQDTVYATGENSRQYFINCFIEGTTDFIFGSSTALFEKCTINNKSDSYITAASTDKGKIYGFVFLNCKLTANPGVTKAILGRPWRDYARVAFIGCEIGPHIAPVGWANWDKTQRDKTAWFAEFKNTGAGASTSNRLKWSKQLTTCQARKYTPTLILKGFDDWNPSK